MRVGVFDLKSDGETAVSFLDADQLVQQRDAHVVLGEHREISGGG
jgi:hypothetical protein